MPFQDVEDDEITPMPRTPSVAEKWLRKVLLEDWGLKLLALVVTFVLWLAVTGQNAPVTQRYGVQLNFIRPAGMELSNEVPEVVEVVLSGSQAKLAEMGTRLTATVDITDQAAGERVIRLNDRAQITLPTGITIQGFKPATTRIRLEPVVESQAEIDVRFEGNLPDGYEIKSVTANPSKVRLRGPSDRVNALKKVMTESVSLDGRTQAFSTAVAVHVPDSKIENLDPTVEIRVEIVQKNAEPRIGFIKGEQLFLTAHIGNARKYL